MADRPDHQTGRDQQPGPARPLVPVPSPANGGNRRQQRRRRRRRALDAPSRAARDLLDQKEERRDRD
jgi:hypothetical protein